MREALIGKDPLFLSAVALARKAAEGRLPCLLVGPPGAGKSHLARWMAARSPEGGAPCAEWSAAAVPEALLESEIFGVEGGVATGVAPRAGVVESAGGGVLCLTQVERLTLHQQASLLRILEGKAVVRLGGTRPHPVRAHILASFQEPPEELAARGLLRQDLLYRMDVLRVDLPPLSQRREDIPALFGHFLRVACRRAKKRAPLVGRGLEEALADHPWPGNLWQLRQAAELLATAPEEEVTREHLPASFWVGRDPLAEAASRRLTLAELKDAYIRSVLARVGGSRTRAAQWLGVSRKALWEHLKRGES